MTAEQFLAPPTSDYAGWELSEPTAVQCTDCDAESDETDMLADLVAWADEHAKTCTGTPAEED